MSLAEQEPDGSLGEAVSKEEQVAGNGWAAFSAFSKSPENTRPAFTPTHVTAKQDFSPLTKLLILLIPLLLLVGYQSYSQVFGSTLIGYFSPKPSINLESGLIAHWTFDGLDMTTATSSDVSGNGYNLALDGNPKLSIGKIGQAIELDGASDSLNLLNNSSLNLDSGTSDFTLSGWFKRNSFSTRDVILAKRANSGTGESGYMLEISGSDYLIFRASDGVDDYTLNSLTRIENSDWHHFTIVWGDNTIGTTMYIDGRSNAPTAAAGSLGYIGNINFTNYFRLGVSSNGSDPFDGKLDDVRIYDHSLSSEEVAALYAMTKETKINTTQTPTNLETGLVGHWTFDGPDMTTATATDVSGTGNDGTLISSPTKIIGKTGQAIEFNGIDNYIFIEDNSSLDITNELTISAWVNKQIITTCGDYDGVIGKGYQGDPSANYALGIFNNCDDEHIIFYYNNNSSEHSIRGNTTLQLNTWNLLTVTYNDASNNISLYVNGVLESKTVIAGAPETNSLETNLHGVTIGAKDVGYWFIPAKIDDVRVYNRAISADEVQKLYNLGEGTKFNVTPINRSPLSEGLVGHWTFDGLDMTTATATDVSGNGNNATLLGNSEKAIGKMGQGISLDGTNSTYITTNSGSGVIDASQDITIGVWVKPRVINQYQGIISKSAACDEPTSKYLLEFLDGGATFWMGGSSTGYRGSLISLNEWSHIAVTNNANGFAIYKNGVLEKSGSALPAPTSSTADWTFGNCGGLYYSDMNMDDVRIYNRALSATEVDQLYNQGR